MAKQTIEISFHLPDGYEFVRLSQHSNITLGESVQGTVRVVDTTYFIIAKLSWQWPDWLTAEWIAMDQSGVWFCHTDKPRFAACDDQWLSADCYRLSLNHTSFTPPPCTDWKQSLRRNPKAEAKQ